MEDVDVWKLEAGDREAGGVDARIAERDHRGRPLTVGSNSHQKCALEVIRIRNVS